MSSAELETLQWQFQLVWRLAEIHLPKLTDELCLWEPVPGCWTVRKASDGIWRPDWSDVEPDPAPPATVGWITWQIVWWWSGALAAIGRRTPPAHDEVAWPGSANATVQWLGTLSTEWSDVLSRLDESHLERPFAYPWSEPRPLRLMLAWANSELMKSIAEIGCLRHQFERNPPHRIASSGTDTGTRP